MAAKNSLLGWGLSLGALWLVQSGAFDGALDIEETPGKHNPTQNEWSLGYQPDEPTGKGLYFYRCAEARALGVAPIRRGQPGYREGLDGDGDGIACEPYRH